MSSISNRNALAPILNVDGGGAHGQSRQHCGMARNWPQLSGGQIVCSEAGAVVTLAAPIDWC